MGFIDKINRFIGLYVDTFKALKRPGILLPFLIYACFQVILLQLLVNYTNPGLYPVLSPVINLIREGGGDYFAHYPGLYTMLPLVFQYGKFALGLLFEGLMIGLTVLLFLRIFKSDRTSDFNLSTAFKNWPRLFVVWGVIAGILMIFNLYFPGFFIEYLRGSPRRLMLFDLAVRLATVGIYSVFLYAVPSIIVYRQGIIRSFQSSLVLFLRYPLFSFFLAFVPFMLSLPISYAAANSNLIVNKFSPELVHYLLLGGVVADLVINFFLAGTIAKFLIDERYEPVTPIVHK